jgi:hypothetical protein
VLATDHGRHTTIWLDDESRAAVHKATCYWDETYKRCGARWQIDAGIGDVRHQRDTNVSWWKLHMAASAECAAHVLLGIMFSPKRYKNYDRHNADVGGVIEVRARDPRVGVDLIVAQSDIDEKPDMPQLLCYVNDLHGQRHAQVTFMGWAYNRDVPGIAYLTKDALRPGWGTQTLTHYYVNPTALHPMAKLPKLI